MGENEEAGDPMIAFVGLSRAAAIDRESIASKVASILAEPATAEDGSGTAAFHVQIADRPYAIAEMAFPIPPADLALAARTAYGWPQAATAVRQASAHCIVVALRPPTNPAQAVRQAADLSAIAAALAETLPAAFVYWQAGDVVTAPPAFIAAAKKMVPERRPPTLCWVQFCLTTDAQSQANDRIGMRTAGLMPFIGHEVEVPALEASAPEAAKLAVPIADYLLREVPPIREGDTVDLGQNGAFEFRLTPLGPKGEPSRLAVHRMSGGAN